GANLRDTGPLTPRRPLRHLALRRLDKRAELGPVRDVRCTRSRWPGIVEPDRPTEKYVQRRIRETRIAQVLVVEGDRVRHRAQLRVALHDLAQVAPNPGR